MYKITKKGRNTCARHTVVAGSASVVISRGRRCEAVATAGSPLRLASFSARRFGDLAQLLPARRVHSLFSRPCERRPSLIFPMAGLTLNYFPARPTGAGIRAAPNVAPCLAALPLSAALLVEIPIVFDGRTLLPTGFVS